MSKLATPTMFSKLNFTCSQEEKIKTQDQTLVRLRKWGNISKHGNLFLSHNMGEASYRRIKFPKQFDVFSCLSLSHI